MEGHWAISQPLCELYLAISHQLMGRSLQQISNSASSNHIISSEKQFPVFIDKNIKQTISWPFPETVESEAYTRLLHKPESSSIQLSSSCFPIISREQVSLLLMNQDDVRMKIPSKPHNLCDSHLKIMIFSDYKFFESALWTRKKYKSYQWNGLAVIKLLSTMKKTTWISILYDISKSKFAIITFF